MRLVCFIDYLCQGGAQRQLTTLALFFQKMGHEVLFVTYHDHDFFRPTLQQAGIPERSIARPTKLQRVGALRSWLKSVRPDAVLAFLEGPCLYAELATLPSRSWGLVVSERLQVNPHPWRPDFKRWLHHLADYVTANSHANRHVLETMLPRLKGRIATIYNCLDLDHFRPPRDRSPSARGEIRLLAVASYQERKNTLGLIEAVALALRREPQARISLDWFGGIPFFLNGQPDTRYFEEAQQRVRDLGLTGQIRLHPAERHILPHYQAADAVILPSFQEGLPNTVCEGMACGRPILASRIGDAAHLVQPKANGFLFDPASTESMAEAILALARMAPEEKATLGAASRQRAESFYAPSRVAQAYVTLLDNAATRRRLPVSHWPPEEGQLSPPASESP